MGVITRPIWKYDPTVPGGIKLENVPDADAYGLAIVVANAAERTALVPANFHDGTFVIQRDTRQLYFVDRVANAIVAIA